MSDIVEKLRAEIARKQDAEGDHLYLASPCPVLTEAAETIVALRAEGEALRGHFAPLIEAFDAHKVANERTNAAIPNITTATRAEYAVYDERYRISEEAKRDWHKAIFGIITDEDFRAALSTTEAK